MHVNIFRNAMKINETVHHEFEGEQDDLDKGRERENTVIKLQFQK